MPKPGTPENLYNTANHKAARAILDGDDNRATEFYRLARNVARNALRNGHGYGLLLDSLDRRTA